MKQSIRFAPPHSIFFLEDSKGGTFPKIDDRALKIWSTRSCIIIGCLCEMDGETEISASASLSDAPSTAPVFEGMLDTPSGIVDVLTSDLEVLIRCEVETNFTRVRIWTDRPSEPKHIQVVFG